MPRLALAALSFLTIAASPAVAQEFTYLDDRSDPAALVRSLYNAIARGEYARAWSYFSQHPAESLDAYAKGFENTRDVEVLTGTPREEGTAGSIYYEIPVAVSTYSADNTHQIYAGCYTLRMADPTVGEEFEPLHIETGELEAVDTEFSESLPKRCGDGPELPEHDAGLETAKAIYANLEVCNAREPFQLEPEIHEISFRYDFDGDDRPDRVARLYRMLCYIGAYNQGHVYFLADDHGEVAPLHFAQPALDIRYEDDDHEKLKSMTVVGLTTLPTLVNSEYDPETRTITAHSYWRGLGDASSQGKWIFRRGQFDLVRFEVDPTYDGEITPEVVVDYEEAP